MVSADTEEIGDKQYGRVNVVLSGNTQYTTTPLFWVWPMLSEPDAFTTMVSMLLSVAILTTPLCKVSSIEESASLDDFEDIQKDFLDPIEQEFEDWLNQ